ncbi:MAG: hypothetical protein ACO3RU_11795 [Planctomycetota bacterium]
MLATPDARLTEAHPESAASDRPPSTKAVERSLVIVLVLHAA